MELMKFSSKTYEKEDAFFAFGKWDPNDTQNESDQDGHRGRQGHVEYNFVREVGYNGQKRLKDLNYLMTDGLQLKQPKSYLIIFMTLIRDFNIS